MMPEDKTALQQWVKEQLQRLQRPYHQKMDLAPLHGDAGFRRYFRVATAPAVLAVEAPADKVDNQAFVALARYLRDNGIYSPEVLAVDFKRGFLLVEDLGDQLFLRALNTETVESLYGEALMMLLRLQQCRAPDWVPAYGAERLLAEMRLLEEWFIAQVLGYRLNDRERNMLDQLFNRLVDNALAQPQVLVHRDFHSRNLLVREGGAPGVIDVQDAVLGPLTYDLVSLLRDCYIRWPREDIDRWALAYGDMAVQVGLMPAVSRQEFLRWFDWMGLQRHIKVLGLFSRLWLRDDKASYLRDLPLVMRYTLEVAESYPDLRVFSDWFKEALLPLVRQQSWYCDYRLAGDREEVGRRMSDVGCAE